MKKLMLAAATLALTAGMGLAAPVRIASEGAYPPYNLINDKGDLDGYDIDVGNEICKRAALECVWVKNDWDSILPNLKSSNYDAIMAGMSITDERKQAVDFSSGYYDVRQAVITYKGSPIDGKTTVADLKGAKLGAQVGTTSYNAAKDQVQPSAAVAVFDTNDLAVQALKNKQIDGIVADLPTAFYMTAAQLDDGVIVGQLPLQGEPEQFGAVLDKGSPLTGCVTQAVDTLRENGTLDTLVTTWLSTQGAPELK